MATINAQDLPRPVAPGETAPVTPPIAPPAYRPTPPVAAPGKATVPSAPKAPTGVKSAKAAGKGISPRLLIGGAAVGLIALLAIGGGIVAGAGAANSGGGSAASPAAEAVTDVLGVDGGAGGGCLAEALENEGIDEATVNRGSDPSGVSNAVMDCIDIDVLSAQAAANAASVYDVDQDCVEENLNGAGAGVWGDYLEAVFGGDSGWAGDIENEVFGHC